VISGLQVLDHETSVSQVEGVFARQIVEGAVATGFFLLSPFFFSVKKGGMENLFVTE